MRCHEILITFMRATQVPQSGIDFATILKEFTLLEKTGKSQLPSHGTSFLLMLSITLMHFSNPNKSIHYLNQDQKG